MPFLLFIYFDTHLLHHIPCQYPVTLLCSQAAPLSEQQMRDLPSKYMVMGLHFNGEWNSGLAIEELEWQLYLWLAQEGIMLLICTNLLCPTPPSLFLCFPLLSSSAFLSLISCLQCLHRAAEHWFLLTEMLPSLSCGESVGVDEKSGCIVAPCLDWQ